MRPVPDIATQFVKDHEGCKLTAYIDVANCPTVGFGHTGPEVVPSQTISQALADIYLREDLDIAAKRLARVVEEAVILKLSDHQYAALISFCFNAGAPPHADLWGVLNAQKFELVPHELSRWIYAKRKVVPGLVNRRAAEVALWSTPDEVVHDSGCAQHNEPYLPAGPCDCSAKPAVVVPFPAKPAGWLGKLRSMFG